MYVGRAGEVPAYSHVALEPSVNKLHRTSTSCVRLGEYVNIIAMFLSQLTIQEEVGFWGGYFCKKKRRKN